MYHDITLRIDQLLWVYFIGYRIESTLLRASYDMYEIMYASENHYEYGVR